MSMEHPLDTKDFCQQWETDVKDTGPFLKGTQNPWKEMASEKYWRKKKVRIYF
jgi:hypothetical protein